MFDLGIGIVLLLFGAGTAAGALNAVAGGATFFTLAELQFKYIGRHDHIIRDREPIIHVALAQSSPALIHGTRTAGS